MEQRPLRLGDTVDDYCPRERRITNHVIAVIVGDAIHQTRCSTCDFEHAYKEAREPRRRKKDGSAGSDGVNGQLVAARVPSDAANPVEASEDELPPPEPETASDEPPPQLHAQSPAVGTHEDHWPAHRRLIRATLPRVEGEPPAARPIPEFTMHQRAQHGRGAHHHQRPRPNWENGEPNGNVFNRHASSGGRDRGQGHGHGRPGQGGGKPGRHRNKHKRSR